MSAGENASRAERDSGRAGVDRPDGNRLCGAAVVCALAVLGLAATAAADPIMRHTVQDVGGGLYGHQFTIDCQDGLMEPVWATLTYYGYDPAVHLGKYGPRTPGQLHNIPTFGLQVHEEPGDIIIDPDPTYSKYLDSWLNEEFCWAIMSIIGGWPRDNYHGFDSGNEPGVFYEVVDHAYMVCTGDVVVEGRIGRHNVWYDIGYCTPEPTALALLALGALALIRRRRA